MSFKKEIRKAIEDIKEVLTRESRDDDSSYLGSKIDGKVEVKDFEKFKKEVIGQKKTSSIYYYLYPTIGCQEEKGKTLYQEIESINDRLEKLEKHLGVKYVTEESKFEGYKKLEKKKKRK